MSEPVGEPLLRVVRGVPDDTELAALAAVLLALPAVRATGAPAAHSSWASPARRVRAGQGPRAGGWRESALPR